MWGTREGTNVSNSHQCPLVQSADCQPPSLLHWNIRWTLSTLYIWGHVTACTLSPLTLTESVHFSNLCCCSVSVCRPLQYLSHRSFFRITFILMITALTLAHAAIIRRASGVQEGSCAQMWKAANFSCSFILIIYASQLHNALPRHGSWLQQPFR